MGTVGPPGGSREGGQNRFSKKLIFERFAAKFFSKVSRSKRDTVNFSFNAFLHRNFSSRYIRVPGGVMKG